MIRSPRLMSRQMTEVGRLRPSSLSIVLKDTPVSTAQMTLEADDEEVGVGSWVNVTTPQGQEILFVVRSVATDFATGTRTINLEDALSTLQDTLIFEELTPESMGAGQGATKISAAATIRKLLSYQNLWTLGTCDYTDEQGWSFTNATIYQSLTGMLGALEDCRLTYDTTRLPWRLNVVRASAAASCELRPARNLAGMTMTVDRSGMCTRLYPTGASGLTIKGVNNDVPYLEKNVGVWGVVSRVENDSSIEDADLLKAWGLRMLDRLSTPLVTINVTGLDLSIATGEPLDRLTLGAMCRVPLTERQTVVTERITQLQWRDAIREPESVQVTMANNPRTVQGVLHKLQKKSGGGGGSGTAEKAEKLIYTVFDQTDEELTLMAVAKRRIQTAWSRIKLNADRIEQVVAKYHYNDVGDLLEAYYSSITQTAEDITLMVRKDELIATIEVEARKIRISAEAIDLDGYVTAPQLSSVQAEITNLTTGVTTATYIKASAVTLAGCYISSLHWRNVRINGTIYGFLCSTSGGIIDVS